VNYQVTNHFQKHVKLWFQIDMTVCNKHNKLDTHTHTHTHIYIYTTKYLKYCGGNNLTKPCGRDKYCDKSRTDEVQLPLHQAFTGN
jgi:hypothetical protein